MIKLTLIIVIVLINITPACNYKTDAEKQEDAFIKIEQEADSLSAKLIDSANKAIQRECDTAKKYKLPLLIDSLLKEKQHEKSIELIGLLVFVFSCKQQQDNDIILQQVKLKAMKAGNEKVIEISRQLKADCDSNLGALAKMKVDSIMMKKNDKNKLRPKAH